MLCTATRASRSETGAAWHWTGWLLARAGYVSPCCNVMCLWYMCFCAEVFFFSVLRLYSKWSIVWGLKKFFSSSLSSCKKLYFLNTLSPVLSTPLSYVCCVCMDRLMANFAGTCTSDNKGLLLLLLLLLLARPARRATYHRALRSGELIPQNEWELRCSAGSGMLKGDPLTRGAMLALPITSSGEWRTHSSE